MDDSGTENWLRDAFASASLPALLRPGIEALKKTYVEPWRRGMAAEAYRLADAMLEARRDAAKKRLKTERPQ